MSWDTLYSAGKVNVSKPKGALSPDDRIDEPVVSKHVVRVISIEGNPEWVDNVLSRSLVRLGQPFYAKSGMIKELRRVELKDNENLAIGTVTFDPGYVPGWTDPRKDGPFKVE